MAFADSLSDLSNKQLAMIDRKDRGKHLTAKEATDKQVHKLETDLQNQVVGMLRRNGIEPIINQTGKKTTTNVGCPDIMFAVKGTMWDGGSEIVTVTIPYAWEFKIPPNKSSRAQLEMAVKLTTLPNYWAYQIITSYDQAVRELKRVKLST